MGELEEKVAIVTGASRGIGKAMALGLAGAGASVVVAARSETARPGPAWDHSRHRIRDSAARRPSLGGGLQRQG